ncbi:MAG: gamma-glutamylcyclotransferase family protein [Planctomycetota bacterium]
MGHDVFTYGTLMVPDVMWAVTEKHFQSCNATLHGFNRFRVRQEVYPAIVAAADASTTGRLYLGVDADSLKRLDDFEGEYYTRQSVTVTDENDEERHALAYVIADVHRHRLSEEPWDEAAFVEHHLPEFLKQVRGWMS